LLSKELDIEKSVIFQCFRHFVQTDFLTKPLPTLPPPQPQPQPQPPQQQNTSNNNDIIDNIDTTMQENDEIPFLDKYGNYEDPGSDEDEDNENATNIQTNVV
jgi:hypothetical protein